jgi:hypothetical protein
VIIGRMNSPLDVSGRAFRKSLTCASSLVRSFGLFHHEEMGVRGDFCLALRLRPGPRLFPVIHRISLWGRVPGVVGRPGGFDLGQMAVGPRDELPDGV